ncbi:TonB-dependent receptor [Paraglaciecola sp. 2405UD69-4]|uniref:TonB-dependent receptor n=1 Tax=Paraglaciecola sp. 2405UD69-4 TaxID=3391836 RepID=UPI0039C92B6D
MRTSNKIKTLTYVIASLLGSSTLVQAQEVTDEAEIDSLEVITVTSRKVSERILDIPIAINAFTKEDIKRKSIEELDDVALMTPGLTFEDFSNGGFGSPVIRGASQFSVDQLEQNVSVFLDGVYIPRQYAVDMGSLDMERIEVVKGPQSALYGANAFMGAINYVTRKADLDVMYGDVEVILGDGGRQDLSGEISIPIIEEKLAVKFTGSVTQYDGDWDNDHPAASEATKYGTDEDLGGWDNQSFGISVVAQPTDALNLELAYNNYETLSENRASSRLSAFSGDLNCGTVAFSIFPKVYCGELPETPLEAGSDTETGFLIDPRGYIQSETEFLRFSGSYQFTEELSMTYQFANIDGEVFAPGNADRSPLEGTVFFTPEALNYFTTLPSGNFDYDTHELRFEYTADSGFYAMFGVYSSDGEDLDDGASGYGLPLWSEGIEPIRPNDVPEEQKINLFTKLESDAIFGRISVPLLDDKLTFAAEARYSDEKKVSSDTTGEYTYKDNFFTPRVSLDYHLTNDQLFYFSAAKGVKSGGINDSVVSDEFFNLLPLLDDERFYGPDENITYEIGSKGRYLDGRLDVEAALYYIDWSNLQVSVAAEGATATTSVITANLGSATSQGLELSTTYAITDSLVINAGLALNDATYDDGVISQRVVRAGLCDDIVCSSTGDIGGNDLARSANTQWNFGAQYSGSLSDDMEYFLRADVAGQSKQYVSEINAATIPARTLVNLRAGINNESWSAEFWVKNATDEEYVANAFYIASPFFVDYVPTWGNLRRMGITVSYNF